MSIVLDPSPQTISAIRSSVQRTMKTDLPPSMQAEAIVPFISSINRLSSHVSFLVESPSNGAVLNDIFCIRNEIHLAPRYTQNVFGLSGSALPPQFSEFNSFIQKLIEAQKAFKEKSIPKVKPFKCSIRSSSICCIFFLGSSPYWSSDQVETDC